MIISGVVYLIVFAVLTLVLLVAVSVLKNERDINELSKAVKEK